MTEFVCATNFTDLIQKHLRDRPCTVRDRHLESCLDDECRGCLPRRASRGYLCQHCYEKLDDALRVAPALVEHLRSIDSPGAALGDRVSSSLSWKLPMPASWLAADEILEALGAPPLPSTAGIREVKVRAADAVARWSNPEQKVSTIEGAVQAIEFFRQIQTLLHRWPDKEADRTLPDPFRCQNCQHRSLVRQSPIEYLGDIEVVCPSCGHHHDWWQFQVDSAGLVDAVIAAQRSAEAAARKRDKKK